MAEVVTLQQNEKGDTVPEVLASFEKPRIPWHPRLEERYGISRATWKVLVEAIWPSAKTADAVMLAMQYCMDRGLDPMKRPVHIVPMWSTAEGKMVETVWPGIAELRTTAARTNAYAGNDDTVFGPQITKEFVGETDVWEKGRKTGTKEIKCTVSFPDWAQVTLYRMVQGQRCQFVGPKVYWLESYGSVGKTDVPNDMWRDRPVGQLEKCAEAAALRKAFPEVGNDPTAEEMSGRKMIDATPPRQAEPVLSLGPPPAPPVEIEIQAKVAEPSVTSTTVATKPTPEPTVDKPPPTNEELEIPAILKRDKPAPAPEPAPTPAPAPTPVATPIEDDDITGLEEPLETAEDVLRELDDHLATAKSEDEIEQFYSEGDFEARLEAFPGGVGYAREAKSKFLKRLAPKADPFIVPDEFRSATHYVSWVESMIEATKSSEEAEKLRAAWNDKAKSKPVRASLLAPEQLATLKGSVVATITKAATGGPANAEPHERALTPEAYFAQCRVVLGWKDANKIKTWMQDTAEVRQALGITADNLTWKPLKSALLDRRHELGEP